MIREEEEEFRTPTLKGGRRRRRGPVVQTERDRPSLVFCVGALSSKPARTRIETDPYHDDTRPVGVDLRQ